MENAQTAVSGVLDRKAMILENQTLIHEFVVLALHNNQVERMVLYFVLLLVYLVTLVGNLLIIVTSYFDVHLHSPMYYFLSNFSVSEIIFTTNITPNMLVALWHGSWTISLNNCLIQFYVYSITIWAACLLLPVMSYDRYLAICKPLHYSSVMNHRLCLHLASWCWIIGFTMPILEIVPMSLMSYCGTNIIDHFFCDFGPMLQLSCSDTHFIEMLDYVLTFPIFVFPVIFIIVSYIKIIYTIFQIPTTNGRKKSFSTCSSHLIVVCTYYGTCIFIYMVPSNNFTVKKVVSLLYTVVTPLVNPFIYSLRSKDFRRSIVKLSIKLRELR
uniref:Olfactory receptor n=1 Tax=Leptobrachium leishanense TaxID=445787 RepID=A0A8C5M195_9ANUR